LNLARMAQCMYQYGDGQTWCRTSWDQRWGEILTY
jgi:hypothetical protein